MAFKNDEELTQKRIEAGAMVETTVMTPMTSEAVTNFSGQLRKEKYEFNGKIPKGYERQKRI